MPKCKHCGEEIKGSSHHCSVTGHVYSNDNSSEDFLLSFIIANETDSAMLGGIIGGDPVGAILGDFFSDE